MKCVVLLVGLLLPLVMWAQNVDTDALTNETVARMIDAGVPTQTVLLTIQNAPNVNFHLMPVDLVALGNAKVPEDVVKAMAIRMNGRPANSPSAATTLATPVAVPANPAPAPATPVHGQTISSERLRPLHLGQPELYGSLAVTNFTGANLTKPGLNVDGGVTLHPNFTLVGEYNLTPLGSAYGASARYQYLQAGGRFNMVRRGRVIPFALGTAGLLRVSGSLIRYFNYDRNANAFGFGIGGGLLIRATNHLDTKLEFKGYRPQGGPWFPAGTVGIGARF